MPALRSARVVPFLVLCAAVITGFFARPVAAQEVFPRESWERISTPESAGWSSDKLKAARDYSATIKTSAVMIVAGGKVVDEWGETATRFNVHSIRKSLLTAMYGIYVADGRIDLTRTMGELGMDDNEPSLTEIEKGATLHDLLKARSGIYHPALYETPDMKAARPKRGSHPPGSFWYYNNWDFNAAGMIFERAVKNSIFREFKTNLAEPLGMQDYRIEDGQYVTGPDSVYAAYPFRLTARDMARFGLLFLRNGRWGWRQIIPAQWVKDSVTSYSETRSGGYGYMWWVATNGKFLPGVSIPDGSYAARGAGGHYILVIPAYDLVIVHRVNTDIQGTSVSGQESGKLVKLILEARR